MTTETEKCAFEAIERVDIAYLRQLLDNGVSYNARGDHYADMTLVAAAARKKNLDMLMLLINGGADIGYVDNYGDNCIRNAVLMKPNDEVIEALMKAGADPETKNHKGLNAYDACGADDNLRTRMIEMRDVFLNKKPALDPLHISFNRVISGKDVEEIYLFDTMERITYVHPKGSKNVEAMSRDNFSDLNDASYLRAAFEEHQKRGGACTEQEVFYTNTFNWNLSK